MKNIACEKSVGYQIALDLAESGQHNEALVYLHEYLCLAPNDAEALNDAGAILHCLGRSDEGITHLLRARGLRKDSAEIIWNLAEAFLSVGKAKEACELFDDMKRVDILNADIINRTADVFLKNNNLIDAARMLTLSLELWPGQEILVPMLEVINKKISENN